MFGRKDEEASPILRLKRKSLVDFVAGWLFVIVFYLDSFSFVSFSLMGLWLTVGLFLLWRIAPDFRRHYLVAALFCLLASFAPTLGLLSGRLLTVWMYGLYGAICVVLGLFDHFLLIRTFLSLPEEEESHV